MNLTNHSKLLNINYYDFLNNTLITNNGYKFGRNGETVSSVLGKNKLSNSLSPLGQLIVMLLNLYEPDHAIKSIKDY